MRQEAYKEFAKSIGRPPLTDREKQMAIVNHILEGKTVLHRVRHQWVPTQEQKDDAIAPAPWKSQL